MTDDAQALRDGMFHDRRQAGRILAAYLTPWKDNAVVLGIPRGGVVVADEVASELGADLDVIVARKLGAPSQPELAIGAVTADGTAFLNEELIGMLGVPQRYLDTEFQAQRRAAERREAALRGPRPAAALEGRVVIVVDDGFATGATARAAVRAVRQRHPRRIVAAAPVASAEACAGLRLDADDVVCPLEPPRFGAVGLFYHRFEPVSEDEVRQLLAARAAAAASPGSDDRVHAASR